MSSWLPPVATHLDDPYFFQLLADEHLGPFKPELARQMSGTIDDTTLRTRWRELVGERLPAAATGRGWPIRFDHCFARVLLDNACGGPWRESIAPPAWRNASHEVLVRAIELGESVLEDRADLHALNRCSLQWRGKLPARR